MCESKCEQTSSVIENRIWNSLFLVIVVICLYVGIDTAIHVVSLL